MLSSGPKESVAKTPKTDMAIVAIRVAFLREIFSSSEKQATTTSSREIVEVNAAIASRIKNNVPKKSPPGIC